MSGDNLHGKQPIKFYSEKITVTKMELLERQLSLGEKVTNLDVSKYSLQKSGRNEDGSYISKIPANYVIDDKFINRGQERYNIFCSPCHAISGNGMGAVMSEDYSWNRGVRPANLLDLTDKEDICDDGYLYDVITNGKGRMGGYGHQIGIKDRWAIVSYLRVLAYASGSIPNCCSDLNNIKDNLRKMKSLETQLMSDDFECLVENHSKNVQKGSLFGMSSPPPLPPRFVW